MGSVNKGVDRRLEKRVDNRRLEKGVDNRRLEKGVDNRRLERRKEIIDG